MNPQIRTALENIYISPLELCNLNCRLCYTKKTKNILTNEQILDFISRYQKNINLKSVLFCGGEVFTLKDFPHLVNQILSKNIFVSIITNGTIDKLEQIKDPSNCQLLVSLDGPKQIHDANRGIGNFDKTIKFIKHALSLKFPVEIMFLVTSDSYKHIKTYPQYLSRQLYKKPSTPAPRINYITYKSTFYCDNHPLATSVQNGHVRSLQPKQLINIKKHYPSIPAKNFGCFQLSVQSNGSIYGCCESPLALGKLSDPIKTLISKFLLSLTLCTHCPISSLNPETNTCSFTKNICLACTNPDFLCGYKKELSLASCQQVVEKFNHETPKS